MYTSIRPPDRKIVPSALMIALPRYPPNGGLATLCHVRPPSRDRYAVLSWLPAPGSLPQPRNSRPPAAATAPEKAAAHGSGSARQRAEPVTEPASSTGLP